MSLHAPPVIEDPAELELLETSDDEATVYEYVDGERVEKNMSLLSQAIGFEVGVEIKLHLRETGTGGVVMTEPYVRCFDGSPETRRRPDVAYWRHEQYPNGLPPRGDALLPPALAVEVVSPGDSSVALEEKLAEYYRAGVEVVWVIHDSPRRVRVERPDGTAHVYREGETIPGDPVLPDLAIPVAAIFPKVEA